MLEPATPAFMDSLRAVLPASAFREPGEAELTEPRGRWRGQGVLVAPGSVEEVATLLRACHAARVGVVPQSGGTGLVAGQVMPDGPLPVILSLVRMDRLRASHPSEGVIVAEAGVTLAQVQEAAREAGRLFPLSIASEGTARVGGILATNAGGTHVLRWGNARALCLGIEAVTADGRIWRGLSRLRKDNAGYDLRDLLIGSEGTLAVITAATLRLVPRPAVEGAAMLAVPSPAAALDLLALAQDVAGDQISGFELIARQGLEFLDEAGIGHADPLSPRPAWTVLLDLGVNAGVAVEDLFARIWEQGEARGLVTDGVIASSEAQRAAFWHLRESIPAGNRVVGSISSHDISLPLSEIAGFIERGREAIAALGPFRVNCFGHLGDGNLHYNVFPPKGRHAGEYDSLRGVVQETVHGLVHAAGGSFAAEHGVGRLKVGDLERWGDPVMLSLMRGVKQALDPAGILNPGAMLRAR